MYLRTKFQVSSIVLTSFRVGGGVGGNFTIRLGLTVYSKKQKIKQPKQKVISKQKPKKLREYYRKR